MRRVQPALGLSSSVLILKKKPVHGRLPAFMASQHLRPLPPFEVVFADGCFCFFPMLWKWEPVSLFRHPPAVSGTCKSEARCSCVAWI